jgi:hypothetical protein
MDADNKVEATSFFLKTSFTVRCFGSNRSMVEGLTDSEALLAAKNKERLAIEWCSDMH